MKTKAEKIKYLNYISTDKITKLNELIYAGAKLVCEKIQKARKKIKNRMGNSTGNADEKCTKTGPNDKTKEKRWNMYRQKRKGNTRKTNTTSEEIIQKVLAKERKLKRYRQRVKQYRQNGTFQNNERKFTNNWEEMT